MKSFKVSIILPVYNVEKYLGACLDSLLAQTLEDIEIVAVNDGSTDGSLQILQAYQALNLGKLFIYSIENHGVSYARNYGFAHSHGEYVWFVDSDDYVEAEACRLLYEKAISDGNDLVLFRYYNVDSLTGERTEYENSCYNQNFRIADKPYELPAISPYPWIKFIRRDLFMGLHFPEGIRFEDLPVAYLLAAKARSIGYLDHCFYNYRKNVGFLSCLTPSTLHIKNAIIFLKEEMQKLGFWEQYRTELDFIAVRHFFYRFWKLLTNYEADKKELKLRLVNELFDYMEAEIPDWEDNHYVLYSLPSHIVRLLCLYGSRQEMLHFIEACNGMSVQQQKAWIKDYKASHKALPDIPASEMIRREKTASQFYRFAYTGSLVPDPEQIFLESCQGNEISAWVLKLLAHLIQNFGEHHIILSLTQEKHSLLQALLNRYLTGNGALPDNITLISPNTEEYGKALALSGYLITDGPLPYYFRKQNGQFVLLHCGHSLYPETSLNTPASKADTGLWQHTMFLADALYFNSIQNRTIYMKECMTDHICPTPYIIGNSTEAPVIPQKSHREKIRRSLQLEGMQTILYAPLLPGSYMTDTAQTFRNFMSALYILDLELSEGQVLYLHFDGEKEIDFSVFTHIKEMPRDFDVSDFASACDVFVSDYHSALSAKYSSGTRVLRFLCGSFGKQTICQIDHLGNQLVTDEFFPDFPAFCNAPQLVRFIGQLNCDARCNCPEVTVSPTGIFLANETFTRAVNTELISSGTISAGANHVAISTKIGSAPQYLITDILDFLLNGRPLPYYSEPGQEASVSSNVITEGSSSRVSEVPSTMASKVSSTRIPAAPRTRVLFFTGRKLSQNLIRDFNALAAHAPDKEFWLAYNDFRNPDSARYLAQLAPGCSCLPLKPDPERGTRWKLASILTSRMGLFSMYPLSHILNLGKKECQKYLGNAQFDQVIITSTDSIKTVATLLAAAPVASYTFDTFSPERYSTSRPYRHQIAFLCRLLKDTGNLELPEELTRLKLTQISGENKDKTTL